MLGRRLGTKSRLNHSRLYLRFHFETLLRKVVVGKRKEQDGTDRKQLRRSCFLASRRLASSTLETANLRRVYMHAADVCVQYKPDMLESRIDIDS